MQHVKVSLFFWSFQNKIIFTRLSKLENKAYLEVLQGWLLDFPRFVSLHIVQLSTFNLGLNLRFERNQEEIFFSLGQEFFDFWK